AAIGQVIAVDRREHDEGEAHLRGRGLHAPRLHRVHLSRAPRRDVAEGAGPRADVPEQEKRGRAPGEALAPVGTARLLAHGAEPVRAHHALDRVEVGESQLSSSDPLGGASHGQRAHLPSGTIQGSRIFSCFESRAMARDASSSLRYGPTRTRYTLPLGPEAGSTTE